MESLARLLDCPQILLMTESFNIDTEDDDPILRVRLILHAVLLPERIPMRSSLPGSTLLLTLSTQETPCDHISPLTDAGADRMSAPRLADFFDNTQCGSIFLITAIFYLSHINTDSLLLNRIIC